MDGVTPHLPIPQPASPLPWRVEGTRIKAADDDEVAIGLYPEDAAFIVALANAAARPDAGEVGR